MRILIDIGHPAHVHLFKNLAFEMLRNGNSVFFTCRNKEYEIELLKYYGFDYKSFGNKYNSGFGKLYGLFKFDLMEILQGIKFKPDVFLSHGSMYAAQAAFFLRKPHISLEDTFNFEQIKLYKPFTKVILTSDYKNPLISDKVIEYSGYHELAYLHPDYFQPDIKILDKLGVKVNEKYVILRFVSWNASHDYGHKGINIINKIKAVGKFSEYAKVFISSEGKLPKELDKYKLIIEPHEIHNAIYYSSLVFGEGATMIAEAGVMGVPAILLNNKSLHLQSDIEKRYGLVYNFTESEKDQLKAIEKGVELLKSNNIKGEWKSKSKIMFSEKIDVTKFLIWFVKTFPESFETMKKTPEYQNIFK